MKIVSSARLKDEVKAQLVADFPHIDFSFCYGMKEVGEEVQDCEVLLTYGEDLTDEHIKEAKQLKWIMVLAAGLEKMPHEAICKRNIIVTNVRGIHAVPMGEYTLNMMLQMAKKTKTFIKNEGSANWERSVPVFELNGLTVGILGAGAIGQEVARLCQAFGMRTLGMNSSGNDALFIEQMYTEDTVDALLRQSDFIVNVLPLTKKTASFMDEEKFASMKKGAYFINIGRGKTVDEHALIQALDAGQLAGAGLDVFEEEPLDANHPFWKHENVTITPHISGLSSKYQSRAMEIFKKNLIGYLNGRNETLTNRIDLTKGY
ncbi:D-2-hydroxyacid dehydrogenase [Alkalihalophilus marmarensis]|jgi:phosphoglycerate dehydrogenase-like enzyme|uniref:3-phosphoglycerate dehydrogenase n=1 Tax=Alkalihalophilus marmarensis DSM 21297 TaxID=1188261 RepID=U6SKV6_9BACI|nr:D-2-hydroxyacid dehydrogenase [Alkalihalophilus marmarensis]ERN51276.1 3-phosphoglycerate dehydrogenase [Alkalihalophilus marmarensis DSM 21297]MCM3490200.1 D-2-hydroxyacid dehydrogenase [Alkalihalophilus marmarensis]